MGEVRWSHGRDDWVWSEVLDCWYTKDDYYCLGDRMFHRSLGKTKDDVRWHGSYTDNWHGGIQTDSFNEALAWLHYAEGEGHQLW